MSSNASLAQSSGRYSAPFGANGLNRVSRIYYCRILQHVFGALRGKWGGGLKAGKGVFRTDVNIIIRSCRCNLNPDRGGEIMCYALLPGDLRAAESGCWIPRRIQVPGLRLRTRLAPRCC
jgi:hypothetical protein